MYLAIHDVQYNNIIVKTSFMSNTVNIYLLDIQLL